MDNAVSFISSSQAWGKNLNRLVASGLTFSQQQALTESMWANVLPLLRSQIAVILARLKFS